MAPANFVTECFFLAHAAISFMEKKLKSKFKDIGELINGALKEKDYDGYEVYMGFKLCIDVHVFGKNTLALYRSFLTFTNALILTTSSGM